MHNFLVIGGSGVMGHAAIKAIRTKFGNDATIIANWFGKKTLNILSKVPRKQYLVIFRIQIV